jgi:hypothetical protein
MFHILRPDEPICARRVTSCTTLTGDMVHLIRQSPAARGKRGGGAIPLDCANPMCGFARVRCPDCGGDYLLTFSCKNRYFWPSCRAKVREAWSIWLSEHLLLRVPHRQVVFTIPKMARPFFRYKRGLLGDVCLCAVRTIPKYLDIRTNGPIMPGVAAVIHAFGNRLDFHPHLHFLVTEGAGPKRKFL